MSELISQQHKHLQNIAKLIQYIASCGYKCVEGEFLRTPEQAEIYAKRGVGIKNSLHCKKLASDILLFTQDDKYLTDTKDYLKFGEYWESLDPDCIWGGRFPPPRVDGDHFETRDISREIL